MELKSRSVHSTHLIETPSTHSSSYQTLTSLTQLHPVTIQELLRHPHPQKDLGSFYRLQKTFFYRETIIAVYLLNVLLKEDPQSVKPQKHHKLIQKLFLSVLKDLRHSSIDNLTSLQESKQSLKKMKKVLDFITNLFEKSVQEREQLNSEDFEFLLEILVARWTKRDQKEEILANDIKFIYGRQLGMNEIQRQNKITQLLICPNNQSSNPEKHLLYKQFQFTISSSEIISIIETNQEPHIFYQLSFPTFNPLKSRISQLFEQKDRYSVLESQGQNTESDSNSQIVKDDEFYRISSRILTSVRKNSFNSGVELPESSFQRKKRWLLTDGIIMDEKASKLQNLACDCLDPCALIQHKPANPSSEMYTRSSSLEKSKFLRRQNNLSTSIDLLMRMELESENRRKKSCENSKSYQNRSGQSSEHTIKIKPTLQSNGESGMKINLLNENHANILSGNFEDGETEREQRNKRLLIARSFFRPSENWGQRM